MTLLILIIGAPSISYASKKILILGDSLSSGYKINYTKSWVKLLEARMTINNFDYEIINSSISGDTTKNGLVRIEKDLNKHLPEILILALGSNDGLRGKPVKSIKSNLEKIIDITRVYGCTILLVGFKVPGNYGAIYSYKFHKVFKNLAKEQGLNFVPFLLEGFALDEKNYFLKDTIHPNEKAQPIILDNVWQELEPML